MNETILVNGQELSVQEFIHTCDMTSYVVTELYKIQLPKDALPALHAIFDVNLEVSIEQLEAFRQNDTHNFNKLSVTSLPLPVGLSLSAKENIQKGDGFPYTGELIFDNADIDPTYVLGCTFENLFIQVFIDARKVGNLSRFATHLPVAKSLSHYQFNKNTHKEIATANLMFKIYWAQDLTSPETIFLLPRLEACMNISKGTLLGTDYGALYWSLLNNEEGIEPVFITKQGQLIDRTTWDLKQTNLQTSHYQLSMKVNRKVRNLLADNEKEIKVSPTCVDALTNILSELNRKPRFPNHPVELTYLQSLQSEHNDFGYTDYLDACHFFKIKQFEQANSHIEKAIHQFPLCSRYYLLSYHTKLNLKLSQDALLALNDAEYLQTYFSDITLHPKYQKGSIKLDLSRVQGGLLDSLPSKVNLDRLERSLIKKRKLGYEEYAEKEEKNESLEPDLSTSQRKFIHSHACGRFFKTNDLLEEHRRGCTFNAGVLNNHDSLN